MVISGLEQEVNIKWASFRADLRRFLTQTHSRLCFYFQNFNLSFKYRQYVVSDLT